MNNFRHRLRDISGDFRFGETPVEWAKTKSDNYSRRCDFYDVLKDYKIRFSNKMPEKLWIDAWKVSEL